MKINKRIFDTSEKDPSKVEWEKIARGLYEIIDDISTSFDHYKPNQYNLDNCLHCLRYISIKCKESGKFMYSDDGYSLLPVADQYLPKEDNINPMEKWFKEAWEIEKDGFRLHH